MPCVDSCGSSWTVGEGEPFPGRPSGSDLLALDSCMPLLNLINTIIRHYNGRLHLSSLRKGAAYFWVPVRIAPWAMVEEIDGQIKANNFFFCLMVCCLLS